MSDNSFPENIENLPSLRVDEAAVEKTLSARKHSKSEGKVDFGSINSACAIALHLHQWLPLTAMTSKSPPQ